MFFVHGIFIIKNIYQPRYLLFLTHCLIIIILKLTKTEKEITNIINLSDSRSTKLYISNISIE